MFWSCTMTLYYSNSNFRSTIAAWGVRGLLHNQEFEAYLIYFRKQIQREFEMSFSVQDKFC